MRLYSPKSKDLAKSAITRAISVGGMAPITAMAADSRPLGAWERIIDGVRNMQDKIEKR